MLFSRQVIAAVAVSMLLNTVQRPSSVEFTTSGARVGDPGVQSDRSGLMLAAMIFVIEAACERANARRLAWPVEIRLVKDCVAR